MTTLELVTEAEQRGLALKPAGDYLDVTPSRLCPPDFAEKLKAHKPQLLVLLRTKESRWIEVCSERIGETVFFCDDEDTKEALIKAGGSEWSIYTKAELRTLIEQNRIAPISSAELRRLDEIKRTLNARIHD